MPAKRQDMVPENCSCDTRKEVRLEEEVEELYEHAAVFERWYEEEKVKSSDLRQQLVLAERRLKIAERAFQEAMAQVPSAAAVYVILHKALKDMENVKHGS